MNDIIAAYGLGVGVGVVLKEIYTRVEDVAMETEDADAAEQLFELLDYLSELSSGVKTPTL